MTSRTLQDASLLVLRVVLALIFLNAGYAKLFIWSGTPEGITPAMAALTQLLSVVEPLGAVAILVGFLTRWAGAGLTIIMLGSLYFVRVIYGAAFFTGLEGIGLDFNLTILAGCFVVTAFGAGRWSLEPLLPARFR